MSLKLSALQVFAGSRARQHLLEHGLQARDVVAVPAAAGGPKGLILGPLDEYIFGPWLSASSQTVHLLGASIGAWRMATACLRDAPREFERLAHEYLHQTYPHAPGKPPTARDVSKGFASKLHEVFGGREQEVLSHPRFRLHVFTSRGRHLMRREGRFSTPLGYLGAYASNVVRRRAMGAWLERVVFSDPRERLPVATNDYKTHHALLSAENFQPSILASCSIPFWLQAVHDIPGAPQGAYWDGGITDYHLHLNYASMAQPGLVLYPHFQAQVIPGWLDKALKHRHRGTAFLDNVVLLTPSPEWVKSLPNAKLPDRQDFKFYGDDISARAAAWRTGIQASRALADEFAALTQQASVNALPLN